MNSVEVNSIVVCRPLYVAITTAMIYSCTGGLKIKVPLQSEGCDDNNNSRTGIGQVSEHVQNRADPGPPPATWGAFVKQSGANGGVIQMINLLMTDLDKEMAAAEAEEDSQADYETLWRIQRPSG